MIENAYFKKSEMVCKHCQEYGMDDEFLKKIIALRKAFGKPMVVSSAYRCPEWNSQVSTTGRAGVHTTGRAVDIKIHGEHAFELVSLALKHGFTGIGINQKGSMNGRFIHLDDLDDSTIRPRIWSY